jgi:hypothetical protein
MCKAGWCLRLDTGLFHGGQTRDCGAQLLWLSLQLSGGGTNSVPKYIPPLTVRFVSDTLNLNVKVVISVISMMLETINMVLLEHPLP